MKPGFFSRPNVTTLALCLLAAGVFSAKAAVIQVPDGSFEANSTTGVPDVTSAEKTFTNFGHGRTIGNWQVSDQSAVTLYSRGSTIGPAPTAGTQALLLQGMVTIDGEGYLWQGGVSQDVGVTPGIWQLSFQYAYAGTGSGSVQLNVYATAGHSLLAASTYSTDSTTWRTGTLDITVPSTQHSITIVYESNGIIKPAAAIDGSMTLTEIPEPHQYALVGVLGLLGFMGKQIASRKKSTL